MCKFQNPTPDNHMIFHSTQPKKCSRQLDFSIKVSQPAPVTHIVGTVESDLGKLVEALIAVNNVQKCKDLFVVVVVAIMISNDVLQLLRVTGVRDLPVWYEAGAAKYNIANAQTLFIIQLILMGLNSPPSPVISNF